MRNTLLFLYLKRNTYICKGFILCSQLKYYLMLPRHLSFLLLLLASALYSVAQVPITIKNNWMYVDATLSSENKSCPVSAIIDTGSSYCVIDSTFAVKCSIPITDTTWVMYNTEEKPIKVFGTRLRQLSIGDKVYDNLYCYIANLQSKFKEYAPSFIIGDDVLCKNLWNLDLKRNILSFPTELPKQKKAIKWSRKGANFRNDIIIKAKVNGENTYFFLDTGGRRNKLPQSSGITATKGVQEATANIASAMSLKELQIAENVLLQVDFIDKVMDMYLTPEKRRYLNIQFLQGKSFILDYKRRCIFILE